MLLQQFESTAGEPLGLVHPSELELAEGEIRKHVRGRCGVPASSRQPARLREWNPCLIGPAEKKEGLPQTEERLPTPTTAWRLELDGALARLGGDSGTLGEIDRTDDGDAGLERLEPVGERAAARSRRRDLEPALDLVGVASCLARDRGSDDGQLRLGLGRRPRE